MADSASMRLIHTEVVSMLAHGVTPTSGKSNVALSEVSKRGIARGEGAPLRGYYVEWSDHCTVRG